MKKRNQKKFGRRAGNSKKKTLFFFFTFLMMAAVGIFILRCREKERKDEKRYEQMREEKSQVNIGGLKKKYSDMVGWLEIPKTGFSYPIMQTKEDPEYYLHRDEKGEYSFYGTPFLDARCSLESDNLIVYGHNINGKRFFGYLQNYREFSFYQKHKKLCFEKVNDVTQYYPVVAVVETDIYSECYQYTDVYNDEEYRDFVKEILDNSLYNCEMSDILEKEMKEETVEAFFHKYQFLTLSTCRTGEGRDARLLVIGCKKR